MHFLAFCGWCVEDFLALECDDIENNIPLTRYLPMVGPFGYMIPLGSICICIYDNYAWDSRMLHGYCCNLGATLFHLEIFLAFEDIPFL